MILPIPPSTVLEDGWDEETSLLFARLNLEDIQNIQASRKGKGRIDAPASDEELAFAMEAASLQSLLRAFEDRQFSRSLDSALRSDREALDACSAIERGERDDHLAALACSRGEVLPRPSEYQQSLEKPR